MNKNNVILSVLEKAAEDLDFYGQLARDYSAALNAYNLSQEEAMRIGTGDINWIEAHIGEKIDNRLREKVFMPLLSREIW